MKWAVLQLTVSIVTHKQNLPEQVQAVRFVAMPGASRESLTEAWKAWMQTAGEQAREHQVRCCRLIQTLACSDGDRLNTSRQCLGQHAVVGTQAGAAVYFSVSR